MSQSAACYHIKPTSSGVVIVRDEQGVTFEELAQQLIKNPQTDWQSVSEFERYRIAKQLKSVQRLPVAEVTLLDELLQPPLFAVQDRIGTDFHYFLEMVATADQGAEVYFDYQLADPEQKIPLHNRGKIQLSQQEIVGLLNFFKL